MKIRSDFVTNSSSSSFILGFNSLDEIEKIADELPSYWADYVKEDIVHDINNGVISKMAAIDTFLDNVDMCIDFRGTRLYHYSREQYLDEKTDVGMFIREYYSMQIAEYVSQLDKYNVFSIVEYEDHTELGNELEHNIMPYLQNTITRFSHH